MVEYKSIVAPVVEYKSIILLAPPSNKVVMGLLEDYSIAGSEHLSAIIRVPLKSKKTPAVHCKCWCNFDVDNLYRKKTQNKQLKETLEALSLFRVHFLPFVKILLQRNIISLAQYQIIGAISTHWCNIKSLVPNQINRAI